MKKKSTLIRVTALLTANSVLFASCTNGYLLNSDVEPVFDKDVYASNPETYNSPFFVDNLIGASDQLGLRALAELSTDLFDNVTLANALRENPSKILKDYGLSETLLPPESREFNLMLTLADPVVVNLLNQGDLVGYSLYLKEKGLIATDQERFDIKSDLSHSVSLYSRIRAPKKEVLMFVGAGIVAVAAAIAIALTTAVVYSSVAFWGPNSRTVSSSDVDKLSSDIANSLLNVEAIDEQDVSSMTDAIEESIIESISD